MSLKKLIDKIDDANKRNLAKHPAAKSKSKLTTEEQNDLEQFIVDLDVLWKQTGEDRKTETDGFHPSHLGAYCGKCPRRAIYLLNGIEKEQVHDAKIKRVFANGNDVHARTQQILNELAGWFEAEVKVSFDDPPIRGHADGVLVLLNGRTILIEIKSTNNNGFLNRLKFKTAKAEHFEQANLYAYLLSIYYDVEIDSIWFIYEDKDHQDLMVVEHKVDVVAATKQIKKWKKLYDEFFLKQRLPVRPYKPDSKQCLYCDVRGHCLADPIFGEK